MSVRLASPAGLKLRERAAVAQVHAERYAPFFDETKMLENEDRCVGKEE